MSLLSPLSGRVRHARTTRVTLSSLLLSLTLMGASLASPSAVAQNDYGLPDLGSASGGISSNDEYRIGRAWLRQFRAHVREWDDPITLDWINGIVRKLAPWSELDRNDFIITLVASSQLNAFAVPGGVVGVNTGLFAFAPDRDAFASVLAHELGHLSQHHFARNMERQAETRLPTLAGFLAGMVIAAGGGGSAGLATMAGTQAAAISDQLAYSRRFEQEADRVGIEALARAGFDPEAMPRMFRAMQRMASLQGGNPPEFLLTHPVTESRISDTQDRAGQLAAPSPRDDGLQYHLVRARALLTIHERDPQQAVTRLAQDDVPEAARRYLDALVEARRGNTDAALSTLDALARQEPDLGLLPASAAEVAFDAGRYDDAIERSRRLLRLMPGHLPATLTLGEALLQRDPDEAWRVLRELAERRHEDPQVFTLLAQAAGRSGREAWGHLARAEQLQLTGHISEGIRQLEVARQVAEREGNAAATARIEQRREAFIGYRETLEKF